MKQYEIILKNTKIKSYRLIALILVVLNFAVFAFLIFADADLIDVLSVFTVILLYLFYRVYISKKSRATFFIDQVAFFVLAGCWIVLHYYVAAILSALIGILYYFSIQKFQFLFTETLVRKMNFPSAEFPWNKFNNVLLRDGILTLDFTNNRLIQMEIEEGSIIDETEFNDFAKQQMKHNNLAK